MQSFDPNSAGQGVGVAIEDRRGRRPELMASGASRRGLCFLVQALGGEAGRQGERWLREPALLPSVQNGQGAFAASLPLSEPDLI
jgi:hypothetical protein